MSRGGTFRSQRFRKSSRCRRRERNTWKPERKSGFFNGFERAHETSTLRGGIAESRLHQHCEHHSSPRLKRVLGLWDLIYYGIILISPIAAVPMFGEAQVLSQGHAVTTLLASMVAMTATAVSFGRMATVYPSAGSVYTYVSRGFNSHIGFVAGLGDVPGISVPAHAKQPVCGADHSATASRMFLWPLLSAVAVGFMTLLCWLGIRTTARTNQILLAFMSIVMAAFLFEAFRYIFVHQHWQGLVSLQPLYDRANIQRARHCRRHGACRDHLYWVRRREHSGRRSS